MAKRRGKSAAAKQQKTPKNPFEGAVLIRACCGCAGAKPTRPKEEEGERTFYHNKKKLERLLNAKIYVKDEEEEKEKEKQEKQEKKEDQPRSRTNHERCRHNKGKKPERAKNDKEEEQMDAEAIIKALDKWCKDNSHMNIKFKAYVL